MSSFRAARGAVARRLAVCSLAAVAAASFVGAEASAADPESPEVLRRRLEDLEQTLASLEHEVARLEAERRAPEQRGMAGSCPDPGAWRDGRSWLRLRRGMSRFDVFAVLGEPGRVAQYEGFERWEYPDFLGGRTHFDDRGRLVGWRPPPGAGAPSR